MRLFLFATENALLVFFIYFFVLLRVDFDRHCNGRTIFARQLLPVLLVCFLLLFREERFIIKSKRRHKLLISLQQHLLAF